MGAALALGALALLWPLLLSREPPARAQDAYAMVNQYDDFFGPRTIRVPVGGEVRWRNEGRNPHTVTADDGSFDSGNMVAGDGFERTFDEEGAFAYFCLYHGAPDGIGMAGYVLVGDAPLPASDGGVGPGREEPPTTAGRTITVPGDEDTIQAGVDAAEPGDLVLVSPGVYREEVLVTTPFITIRGTDRNEVILDGGFERPNGVQVIDADGVVVENLTVRNHLLNGLYWTGVFGYRASYVTAYNNGDYGVYAFDSRYGRIDHSYASGSPDSGFYIGQCDPCHAVITHVLAEHNGLGYSGTNASGDLLIVNSEWRYNLAGLAPNTLDTELLPPQHDAVIAGNFVHDNGSREAPAKGATYASFGNGIVLAGVRDNLVTQNVIEDHPGYGVLVIGNLDAHLWFTQDNEVRGNTVRRSGVADLALGAPAGGGDCFEANDHATSLPVAIEVTAGCGRGWAAGAAGDLGVTLNQLSYFIESRGDFPATDWKTMPAPPDQEQMPGAVDAPAHPAIPEESVPGTVEIRDARTMAFDDDGNDVNREVTVLGIPIATSWWQLLLGMYGYVLPFVLLAAWVTIALWDLLRQDALSNGRRMGWMAVVLLVPFVGAIVYFAFGRSQIPASLRWFLVAGGFGIYVLIAVLASLAGAS